MKIVPVLGDITEENVDVVVNAANERMRGGGGVDGAIHRAGGPAILEDCIARFPNGLKTGDAGWTTAGDMPALWVVHTVGPNYAAGQRNRELLKSAYRRSLEEADKLGGKTVAFPLISAGIYGWPLDDAVSTAIQTIRETTPDLGSVEEVRIVAFSPDMFRRVESSLAQQS